MYLHFGKTGGWERPWEGLAGMRVSVWLVITALTREVGHSKDTEELENESVGYGHCYQMQLC